MRPFTQTFPIDPRLANVLCSEADGILALLVWGCLEWQCDGLQHPAIVEAATTAYRSETDPLGRFLDECCVIGDVERVGGREAFTAYGRWCEAEHLPAGERLSQTAFGTCMKARFCDVGSARKVIYGGVGLLPSLAWETPPSGSAPAEESS